MSGSVRALYRTVDGRWLAATDAGIVRGDATLATWTLVGPGVVGVLAFVPQPGGGALALGAQGAVRSDAQFENWHEDMDGIAQATMSDIAAAGTRLYVATHGGEVFRSDDGAATWQRRHAGLPSCSLRVAALDGGRLFAACGAQTFATYTSADDGATWTQLPIAASFVDAVSANATTAVARDDYAQLWRSTDAGATWTRSPQTFDTQFPRQLVRGGDGALWVRANAGLYRSTDAGATWQAASAGLATPSTQTLWPVSGTLLSLGTTQAWRYDTGTGTWSAFGAAYSDPPAYVFALGDRLLLGLYGGQLLGDAATGHWRRIANDAPPFDRYARLADGRAYALSSYTVRVLRQLSDDRIFGDTLDPP